MADGKKIKTFIIRLLHLGSELPPIVIVHQIDAQKDNQHTIKKQ